MKLLGWRQSASRTAGMLTVLLATLAAGSLSAQTVWELTPYRIDVLLAVESAPGLNDAFCEELAADLARQAETLIGAAWEMNLAAAEPPLRGKLLAEAEAVVAEDLAPQAATDKVLLIAIRRAPDGYRIWARDFDVRTQSFGTVVGGPVGQASKLYDSTFRALRMAISPLAQVFSVEEKNRVTLRLRAAGIPTRDRSLGEIKPGTVFRPVVRYNDREGKPRRIENIPWTFLTVEEVALPSLLCRLDSGMRTPLSGRRRGRTEQLALGVVPPQEDTRLVLRSRANTEQLLSGYDIFELGGEGSPSHWLGRTDRQGSIVVPPAASPVRVLVVKSGNTLLARLPVVPGLAPQLEADIANDDHRLEVEGFLAGLQEELIDLVTRREVLVARALARLEKQDIAEADKLVRELQSLRTREDFDRQIVAERQKIYDEDPAVQRKIDRMFEGTRRLLYQYLDPAPVEKLIVQLSAAKTARSRSP